MSPWGSLSTAELALLQTVFWSAGSSRHALSSRMDYSRSRANTLVAGLLDQGLIEEAGLQQSSGGRRPESLALAGGLGLVIGVDLGATSLEVAVMRSNLEIVARHAEPADVRQGPAVVLARILDVCKMLLKQCEATPRQILAIGMGVPGPVDFSAGQLVNPPLMPDWDGYSIRDHFRQAFAAPVYVDNDVNLMALGELWRLQRSLQNFIVIKVGTGIGCGIVCHGEVYRGASGSAGDVGHICVDQHGPRCHCGNVGCVEAMAAGPAIARMAVEAAERGESRTLAEVLQRNGTLTAIDVGQASRNGDAAANAIIQKAGTLIGQMLASVVNFFNPSHVFIGGGVTDVGPFFLASVRQSVYHRSLALSTRHLEIQFASLGAQAGLTGAGVLAMHEALRGAAR